MQSQGSEIGRICCIHKTRNESGKPQNRTIFVSFESILLSVFEMRQHRIRNMGVLINRDGGDYGSDVVTPTVEEEEENNSQADTQVIQNQHELTERRFPFFVPSNSAWSKKPKRSWKPLSGSSRHILLQYARRAKRYMFSKEYLCSSILATVPEPRRDDVIHLIDRIIKSSTRKLDVRES